MPLSRDQIDASFSKPRARVLGVNPLYGFSMGLCAIGALVLFLAYLSIIGGIAVGTAYFAFVAFKFITLHVFNIRLKIAFYVIAAVLCLILVKVTWTLIKTIFKRYPQPHTEIEVTEENEPVLLHFINSVARSVGAKAPNKVLLTGGVGASASLGGTFRAWFGNTRELRLGMCLFPAMSITSIGGIIAHECGHFSQALGFRLQSLVLSVATWFDGAVYTLSIEKYEREIDHQSDDRLFSFAQMEAIILGILKGILSLFLKIAMIISAFGSRRMEYSADVYEIKFGGSLAFEKTSRQLVTLHHSFSKASSECERLYRVGKLPDNLPLFVHRRISELTDHEKKQIEITEKNRRSSIYASHPETEKRIEAAHRARNSGIFKLNQPGKDLFSNFEEKSKLLTFNFYDAECGLKVFTENLIPVETFASSSSATSDVIKKFENYTLNSGKLLAPFPVDCSKFTWSKLTIPELSELLRRLREQIGDNNYAMINAGEDLQDHLRELANIRAALSYSTVTGDTDVGAQAREKERDYLQKISEEMKIIEDQVKNRINRAFVVLNLLHRPQLCPAHRDDQSNAFKEMIGLLKIGHAFNECHSDILEAHRTMDHLAGVPNVSFEYGLPDTVSGMITISTTARENIIKAFHGVTVPWESEHFGQPIGKILRESLEKVADAPDEIDLESMRIGNLLNDLLKLKLHTLNRIEKLSEIVEKLLPETSAGGTPVAD